MSAPKTEDSPQVKLMRLLAEGTGKRDLGVLESILHRDFRSVLYPRSLGMPEKTREEWLKNAAEAFDLWTEDCEPTYHSITEAPGKVIIHATNKAKTLFGDRVFEVVFTAHISPDDDGSLKIKKTEEFFDSKTYIDFFQTVEAKRKGIAVLPA